MRRFGKGRGRAGWSHWLALLVVLAVTTWQRAGAAQPLPNSAARDAIPPALQDWIPWVLAELGTDACTAVNGSRQCVWPGRLSLDLEASGGSFRQQVSVGTTLLHVLPGQQGAWPQDVKVDGKSRPVLQRDAHAVVELARGDHEISGTFSWSRVPETLHVGHATAFLSLTMGGKEVPLVKREEGNVWLKGLSLVSSPSEQPEQVELSVFRQLRDGIPLQIETRLVFQVSGKARELELQHPLVPSTIPLSVSGDLAVALEPSGALRVQLVPGRHEIQLLARTTQMAAEIPSQKRAEPWPSQEIWAWHPDTTLRAVEPTGPPGIDASRTELPEAWRQDSAYAVRADDVLKLTTTRRAQEQIPPNRLDLTREFWLDEAAEHFTVRDTLRGQMHQGWRLDLVSGELGQAEIGANSQVITRSADGTARGVEVRDAELSLSAVSRVPRSGELAAVGWSEDVDSLHATVRLPAGWDLFAATGVDETSNTWLSRWDLFSAFFLLITALAMARLAGPVAGVVAACALLVVHGEPGAPEYVWLLLIALAALLRLSTGPRTRRALSFAFYSTSLSLVLLLASFAIDQVRGALYPHLDTHFAGEADFDGVVASHEPPLPEQTDVLQQSLADEPIDAMRMQAPQAPAAAKSETTKSAARPTRAKGGKWGGGSFTYDSQTQFRPDAVVQTGPGIPEVSGGQWQLSWSGPVVKDHPMRLYLISPNMMRALTALRLALLGALAFLLWRRVKTTLGPPPRAMDAAKAAAATGLVVVLALLLVPRSAHADEPSDARLAQLKQRLVQEPPCAPDCIAVSRLEVDTASALTLRAEVHAGARAAYKLPGPASVLSAVSLRVDGKPASAIRLGDDGAYYLRLDEGVHRVEMRAQLSSDRTILDVGTPPASVTVTAKGWTVTGVNDAGRVEGGTLTFQRDVTHTPDAKTDPGREGRDRSQVAVPPFFAVTRSIHLAVTGQIVTHIVRQSDPTSPEVLRLQLLPGEKLTTPGIEVKGGVAVVPFPRQETSKELTSTLPVPQDDAPMQLALVAPEMSANTETWSLRCGVVWHCTTEGVTATSHSDSGLSAWTFHPWPGEQLLISATQAVPAEGPSLTVQKATLTLTPGTRLARGELEAAIRTSRATVHTLSIPADATLESVTVDGVDQAVKSDAGQVRVSLLPGVRRVRVAWQDPHGLTALFRSPAVNAGAAGVNYRVVLKLPDQRWLLMAGGPSQGPAILFWGYLVLIVLAALLLGRLPYAPLRTRQWLLLGLGLTQVPVPVALIVVGWFFVVGSRNAWRQLGRKMENLLQVSLVGYTLLFLLLLTTAVYAGLVSSPDMEVRGAGSHDSHLVWYSDRSPGAFAPVWCFSVSIWVWRAFMLAWALWLSKSVLGWLRWGWAELSQRPFWTPKPKPEPTPRGAPTPNAAPGPNPTQAPKEPK